MAQSQYPLPGSTRRDFMKYVVAGGSTLVVGVSWLPRNRAQAQEAPDFFDVGDFLILAEQPYSTGPGNNLVLEVTDHNRIRFELPRLDKGQGIVTAVAMMIAEQMDADYDRVDVELSKARSDRPYSLTGYSSAVRAMWEYVLPMSREARARLITAAATRWGVVDATTLETSKSMVRDPATDRAASYGELAAEAAAVVVPLVPTTPKPVSEYSLVGTPTVRKNARAIATGEQEYTLDLDLGPNTVHAVVARPPTIYGTVQSFTPATLSMPHVESQIVQIPQIASPAAPAHDALEGGLAVAARTFHEAFQARDSLSIVWNPGPANGRDSHGPGGLFDDLDNAKIPLSTVPVPGSTLEGSVEYPYMNHAPLETQTAAAVVTGNTAEVWFASQSPLICSQIVAAALGFPEENVTVHIPPCGGSFGRHLFSEAPVEAALIAQALGKPVKLLWTRKDDMKNGRFRPMSRSDLRATWNPLDGTIQTYEHNVSAAETDFRHGLGDAGSAAGFDIASNGLNQSVFEGSVVIPYSFGQKEQDLIETVLPVPTCSWRSIYSGFTITSNEIFIDELARQTQPLSGLDEVDFRLQFLTDDRAKACLEHVKAAGNWGGTLPANHFHGVACHVEYRSAVAYLVEIEVDATTPSDPSLARLVNAWICVDVGVPINPSGLEAQLQGTLIDGWTTMFRAGNKIENGAILENSYGDFPWARMEHSPPTTNVHVMPPGPGDPAPGGCGELGLPPSCAAIVNAWTRATGSPAPFAFRFPLENP